MVTTFDVASVNKWVKLKSVFCALEKVVSCLPVIWNASSESVGHDYDAWKQSRQAEQEKCVSLILAHLSDMFQHIVVIEWLSIVHRIRASLDRDIFKRRVRIRFCSHLQVVHDINNCAGLFIQLN